MPSTSEGEWIDLELDDDRVLRVYGSHGNRSTRGLVVLCPTQKLKR